MHGKTMKNLIVGIDPGKKGAIAFLDKDTLEAEVYSMPQFILDLVDILKSKQENIFFAVIEKQQPFPRQGIVSTFNLGEHYGTIKGILYTLQIPYIEVSPHKWQKEMIGIKKKAKIKELSLKKAKAFFPYLDIGKNHNKADALLIAEYARRFIYKSL